jgi:hypothetical protein
MIRIGITAIALSVTLISCNGQDKKQGYTGKAVNDIPQTIIKVDKEYDKDGNLIKYDSTYSYYYSNVKRDTNMMDSILNNFKTHFNQRYFFSEDPFFNNFFFQDSLLMYDFYKKDFFVNRFRNNMMRMDSLFWGMDSVKNSFFNKQYQMPGPLIVPEK